jgi:thiol-disulfide isomerase/thioredoxin
MRQALTILAALGVLMAAPLAAEQGDIGLTRDEAVARFGEPRSVLSAGSREILTYPFGSVILDNGRVSRTQWTGTPPGLKPAPAAPAPAPTPAAVAKPAPPPPEDWTTNFQEAGERALATHRRLLVLFTGSDWCPACQQFESQVAHDKDFMDYVRLRFVLVKLDFPRESAQSAVLRSQNEALAKRYKVDAFPTLFIMAPDGSLPVEVDHHKSRVADDYADLYIQAIDEARRKDPTKEHSSWWPF